MRQLIITRQISGRESAVLEKYLQEISRVDLITAEDEARLAKKIKQGDERAVSELIKANLRFVVSVAKQYQNHGLPLADLVNEGNIGLIKAARKFDETLGFKLITYAVWWIRQSIQNAIDEQSRMVRLPSGKRDILKKVCKVSVQLEQELQREPSYQEVEKQVSLSAETIADVLRTSSKHISIDAPVSGSDNLTLNDVIEDAGSKNGEQTLSEDSFRRELESIVSSLPSAEAEVLRLSFGLGGQHPMTFAEISNRLGCSVEQAGALKEKALQRLKRSSRCKALKEYLA